MNAKQLGLLKRTWADAAKFLRECGQASAEITQIRREIAKERTGKPLSWARPEEWSDKDVSAVLTGYTAVFNPLAAPARELSFREKLLFRIHKAAESLASKDPGSYVDAIAEDHGFSMETATADQLRHLCRTLESRTRKKSKTAGN